MTHKLPPAYPIGYPEAASSEPYRPQMPSASINNLSSTLASNPVPDSALSETAMNFDQIRERCRGLYQQASTPSE